MLVIRGWVREPWGLREEGPYLCWKVKAWVLAGSGSLFLSFTFFKKSALQGSLSSKPNLPGYPQLLS